MFNNYFMQKKFNLYHILIFFYLQNFLYSKLFLVFIIHLLISFFIFVFALRINHLIIFHISNNNFFQI